MKIRQSATPYLFILLLLLVGIPVIDKVIKNKNAAEAIVIKVERPVVKMAATLD